MIQMVLLLLVVWLFLCDFRPELGMGRASFLGAGSCVLIVNLCSALVRRQRTDRCALAGAEPRDAV